MLGGVLLLAAAWALRWNALAIMLFAIGGMLLTTGIIGWCPAYTAFGTSSVKTREPS
jgi:Inner membrane protein YgaP-like, transmembrane domain